MCFRSRLAIAVLGVLSFQSPPAAAEERRPDEIAFRDLFRELVETNTTLSMGSCTEAAERMASRLRQAGLPDADIQVLADPDHPREGSLVAVLRGSDAELGAMLLLAHIDVVEAKRADWTRDPFTLFEEDGYFYARGVVDDKAMAASWVDTLVRFVQERFVPLRTIKLALTCGEETTGAFNGAQDLATNHAELIDAAFALNEGAFGVLDEEGDRLLVTVQAGEKLPQNYRVEARNPGGHSSRPRKKNAIYQLAAALGRISEYEFPIQLNDTTRAFFQRMGAIRGGELGEAMQRVAKDVNDVDALALVTADAELNAVLHTTCVATMLEAGHATNALPQRATANVNCRIYPTESIEDVRAALERAVADEEVVVTSLEARSEVSQPPPLTPAILGPIERVSEEAYPGLPVVPIFQAGGTDAPFLAAIGIPTYGLGAFFLDPDLGRIHGLNERIRVESLYDGRDYLYELVKTFASDGGEIP